MVEESDKSIQLPKCSLENDGTINCEITKEILNEIQKRNIKAKKAVWVLD